MTAGFTVWLTGLPGSGKSTIARALAGRLRDRGHSVVVLDGDEVRRTLSADLGFSRQDRDTQVRRVGWICELLTRSGVIAVAALVSPYRATRDQVRQRIRRYVEVHVDAPLAMVRQRDPKGLYSRAAAGQLSKLTGVDDPYEPPISPEVHWRMDGDRTPEEAVDQILCRLESLGYIGTAAAIDPGDDREVRQNHTSAQGDSGRHRILGPIPPPVSPRGSTDGS